MRFTKTLPLLIATLSASVALAEQDLARMSLQDLMNVQVTSVSKKEQRLSKAGAAIFVITQEDIRRSGMTNIPDLLRMVPGVNIARITANRWAISVRGFNDQYATKVLVLVDGRSAYSQQFSGVFWDQMSLPLEDIDRIEVIRGPGGTVWGANAVNGIINIITKHSEDTQGGFVSAGTGSEDSAQGVIRYGGKAGRAGTYRVFGKYFNVENGASAVGRSARDGWHGLQGGFRSDWKLSSADTLMVEGDLFQAREGQTLTTIFPKEAFQTRTFYDRVTAETTNILGRWNRTFSNGTESALQIYYSANHRRDQGVADEQIADADFQYRFRLGSRHDLVAGAGYRRNSLRFQPLYNFQFDPHQSTNLLSTFLQDEIRLTNTVSLTLGSKFEHNSFTGFEFEPSTQLVWSPSARRTLWFSAARAIRQPSWLSANSFVDASIVPMPGNTFGVVQLRGSPDSKAEQLYDYEVGYRTQVRRRLSFDVTGFRSHYRRLTTVESGTPFFVMSPMPPHVVIPSTWSNLASARNYGVEVSANWQASSRWRITPGFSFLEMNVMRDRASNDPSIESSAGHSPKHQVNLRSMLNLRRNLEWDASAYFVSGLRAGTGSAPSAPVDSYVRLDTRLGWRLGEFTELSVAGQNLLSPHRSEFGLAYQVDPTRVQRSVFGKIIWRF